MSLSFEVVGLPRPVLAYALMPDGRRLVIEGWVQISGEGLLDALERTARELGGYGYEVELTPL